MFSQAGAGENTVWIKCREFERDELEEALREYGYELDDLDGGRIDEDFLKEILEDVQCHQNYMG